MRYFDFETVAREAGITAGQMKELCASMRKEFPKDQMMYELHVLRACMAIRDGHVTVEDALQVGQAAGEAP